MNKDIRLHTDFIHIRKRKKLQQELGCDGLLKGWSQSKGVIDEVEYAHLTKKRIVFVNQTL